MNIKNRFKRWFRLRFAVTYPFIVFLAFFCNSDSRSVINAIWLIIAGFFIRIWANGYAIKLEKLTTSGPYAFVRHPLYLGTMLIICGFIVMLRAYYVGILFIAIIVAVYYRTIKNEEGMLEKKFKDLYIDYRKRVPAIVPTIFPYRLGEKWSFSLRRLIKSKEYKPFIWVVIIIIAFHLKYTLIIKHEKIGAKALALIIVALSLGLLDLFGELMKLIYKKKAKQW